MGTTLEEHVYAELARKPFKEKIKIIYKDKDILKNKLKELFVLFFPVLLLLACTGILIWNFIK